MSGQPFDPHAVRRPGLPGIPGNRTFLYQPGLVTISLNTVSNIPELHVYVP